MPNDLVLQSGSWILSSSVIQLASGVMSGMYGTGFDGDLTVSAPYTLARESYYNNLTISGTGSINPGGYRLFVKGILTINSGCSINDDGYNASGTAGGLAISSRTYLGGASSVGATGITIAGNGNASSVPTFTTAPYNNNGISPIGGAGGNCGVRTGGAAGTFSPILGQSFATSLFIGRITVGGFATTLSYPWAGGGSGGGGANETGAGASSGGGGSGGGIVWIAANNIINNGRISANGGNGANASGTGGAGGGGGGSGGSVVIFTNTVVSSLGNIQVNPGIGGTGIGTGSSGFSGNTGSTYIASLGGI